MSFDNTSVRSAMGNFRRMFLLRSSRALRKVSVAMMLIAMLGQLVAPTAQAATFWWDTTTTGTWSNAANWWTTAGGPTTGGPAGSADTADFNGTGVNGATLVQLDGATSTTRARRKFRAIVP